MWCQHEATAQVRKDSFKGNGLTLSGESSVQAMRALLTVRAVMF